MIGRLYNWSMTRLSCCGCGVGCGLIIIGPVAAAGGWVGWTVIT